MGAPIRREPCSACPYRRDVPPGVWSPEEYAKLPPYDEETFAQPAGAFACHATPEHLCHGWAVVGCRKLPHERDLLAGRLDQIEGDIPKETVPLFGSHTEVAEHGLAEAAEPGESARSTIDRLARKHPRLRLRGD